MRRRGARKEEWTGGATTPHPSMLRLIRIAAVLAAARPTLLFRPPHGYSLLGFQYSIPTQTITGTRQTQHILFPTSPSLFTAPAPVRPLSPPSFFFVCCSPSCLPCHNFIGVIHLT